MSNTEWKRVKLGDIGKLTMGSTPSTKVAEYYGGDRLWITPSDIVKGNKYVSETERKLTDLGWSEARHIPANSILITCIASIGKNCIATEEVSCNQQIIALTPSEDYDVHYLYYAICSIENQLHSIAGKATVEIVNKTKLSSVEIDVPSLEEQRRIASLLSRFDELIQLHEFKAENLIKAKQQIMSDILSGGLRELESINPDDYVQDSWVTVKLRDIGKCIRGLSYKKDDVSDKGTLVIRSNNIELGKCVNTETDLQFVTKECKSEQELIAGDIVVCTANGSIRLVGKSSYYDGKYTGKITCGAFCAIYRSNNPLVRWLFQSRDYAEQLNTIVHGGEGSINNLKLSDVLNMQFKIPPTLEEQHKIANLLSSYDSLIELKRSQKQQVTNMKQQLMSQLLTNGGGRAVG